jgi:hypothetical protein
MRSMIKAVLVIAALTFFAGAARAQSIPKHYFSTNTTNSTLVFAKKAFLNGGLIVNTTGTVYYLKLYDKATAPTCGTDTVLWTIPLPINSVPAPIPPLLQGMLFANGIGFCITGALADNDTTVAAAGIVVNLGFSGR